MTIVMETDREGLLPYKRTIRKLKTGTNLRFSYANMPDVETKGWFSVENVRVTLLSQDSIKVVIGNFEHIYNGQEINTDVYFSITSFIKAYCWVFQYSSRFRYEP